MPGTAPRPRVDSRAPRVGTCSLTRLECRGLRHFDIVKLLLAVSLSAGISACGATGGEPRREGETTARDAAAPLPGEEPLETESIGDEEVTGLPPERARGTTAPPASRPCGWSEAWSDPEAPKPLVAGVGDVPNPTKISEEPIRIPARAPLPSGNIIVEFVIAPDGVVREARVVRSTEPPWPSADRAVEEAVRTWRYEPPTVSGTPVAVCATAFVSP